MMKSNKLASEFLVKGDKFLADEKLSEALESYNNCLRYAEREAVEASLAYGARAKVFYRVKLWSECKENIQLAKNNTMTIDEVFDQDLRDIEDHFTSTIVEDSESVNKWKFFKLSKEPNYKIPFIAECLEVRHDDDYGRFIATTKDLNPGDMVIIEEPFYKVLAATEIQKRCSICLKQNSLNLLPCTSCSTAMFCSKKCLESPIHKYECNKFKDNFEKDLLQRMFYQAVAICGSLEELQKLMSHHDIAKKTILDFDLSHPDEIVNLKNRVIATTALAEREPWSKEAYAKYESVTQELEAQIDGEKNFLRNYLVHCLKSMTVNFFHFFWKGNENAGIALCSFAAYFAHSCDPNCDKIDVENKFLFVARKPIKAGDKLSICYDRYNFLTHAFEDRQEYFNLVYTFKCGCEACSNDYQQLDDLPKYDEKFSEPHVNFDSFAASREQYLKNCEYIRDNIDRYPSFELCTLMNQNNRLLHVMGNLPFYEF